MRVLFFCLVLALLLSACSPSDPSLPTLAPTREVSSASEAGNTPEADTATSTEQPSVTPTPAVSSTPTRRPTVTPTLEATNTDVPTATPLISDTPAPTLTPSATARQVSTLVLPTVTLLTVTAPSAPTRAAVLPTTPPYNPASALSAYGQVAPLALANHPRKQLFFISGEPQAGWTVGFVEPNNAEDQAIYQVNLSGAVETLDLIVPLSGQLRPFDVSRVQLDSTGLVERFGPNNFLPTSLNALIYTLQSDGQRLFWEVQDTGNGQRLVIDAVSGMIVP
ncbi:MAG: hypothetical protein NZ750_10780 [Anaerolineae bacterium]|nr:hypothetical protein [Anaerolineae bacterium]MDW8171547.1 hypothetical protein [Anaerolineae bacterium]